MLLNRGRFKIHKHKVTLIKFDFQNVEFCFSTLTDSVAVSRQQQTLIKI